MPWTLSWAWERCTALHSSRLPGDPEGREAESKKAPIGTHAEFGRRSGIGQVDVERDWLRIETPSDPEFGRHPLVQLSTREIADEFFSEPEDDTANTIGWSADECVTSERHEPGKAVGRNG